MPPRIPRSALSALKPLVSAEPEISPLAAAIAARMSGQLQGAGELLGLKGVNMPAAYAGDQRSVGALTRMLNEQETGLASPGRRKFMKQIAATAARQAIPDAVTNALGTNVLKNVVKDALVPTPPEPTLLDDLYGDYGYSKALEPYQDLRDLQHLFGMPDEVYYALRNANPHGFGGMGVGGNYVESFVLHPLLRSVLPNFEEVLSQVPVKALKEFEKAQDEYDKGLRDDVPPVVHVDWSKHPPADVDPEDIQKILDTDDMP